MTIALQAAIAAHIAAMDQELGATPTSPDDAYQRMARVQRASRDAQASMAIAIDAALSTLAAQIIVVNEVAEHRGAGG